MIEKEIVKELAREFFSRVVSIRRHLHQHPELSFQEANTSNYIYSMLQEIGITNLKRIADNGIVALIEGSNPSSKVIALRADIDALPIQETNEVPYKSTVEGIMHACGHDVHTASLLGTTMILNQLKDRFSGTIKLLFQPAEEKLPGGASIMIKEGALENPNPLSIFGQHVHPSMEVGKLGFCPGKFMASADEIFVTIKGKGGHGALPQNCVDPILISAHLITALQQIVSRRAPTDIPTVLTFGKINSTGGATNIIPAEVKLQGTFRTMNEDWRKKAHDLMTNLANQLVEGMGGTCDYNILHGYPTLFNNEALTTKAKNIAIEYLGKEHVIDLSQRMTAEDFAYYSQQMPACFYRLGTGNKEKGITSPVHTSTFDIDEKALEVSTGFMAWLALKNLEQ